MRVTRTNLFLAAAAAALLALAQPAFADTSTTLPATPWITQPSDSADTVVEPNPDPGTSERKSADARFPVLFADDVKPQDVITLDLLGISLAAGDDTKKVVPLDYGAFALSASTGGQLTVDAAYRAEVVVTIAFSAIQSPGTYTLNLRASAPSSSQLPPQTIAVQVIIPSAAATVPSDFRIVHARPFWGFLGGTKDEDLPALTIRETTGKAPIVSPQLEHGAFLDPNGKPVDGDVEVGEVTAVNSGSETSASIKSVMDFPLGTASAIVTMQAAELSALQQFKIQVLERNSRIWIFFMTFLGVIAGLTVRSVLGPLIDLNKAKEGPDRLTKEIKTRVGNDPLISERLNDIIVTLNGENEVLINEVSTRSQASGTSQWLHKMRLRKLAIFVYEAGNAQPLTERWQNAVGAAQTRANALLEYQYGRLDTARAGLIGLQRAMNTLQNRGTGLPKPDQTVLGALRKRLPTYLVLSNVGEALKQEDEIAWELADYIYATVRSPLAVYPGKAPPPDSGPGRPSRVPAGRNRCDFEVMAKRCPTHIGGRPKRIDNKCLGQPWCRRANRELGRAFGGRTNSGGRHSEGHAG